MDGERLFNVSNIAILLSYRPMYHRFLAISWLGKIQLKKEMLCENYTRNYPNSNDELSLIEAKLKLIVDFLETRSIKAHDEFPE